MGFIKALATHVLYYTIIIHVITHVLLFLNNFKKIIALASQSLCFASAEFLHSKNVIHF